MKGIVVSIFLFFSFFFFTPSVSALGIAPGKITMDFVPNEELEFEGYIINSLGGTMEIDVYSEGYLDDYITLLTPDFITLGPYERRAYRFRIKMPDEFKRPGEHESVLWARQHVDEEVAGAVARIKVGTRVIVRVPYPGKYAEIELGIENANVNDTVIFDINVKNLGKENITEARGEIEILDMENNTLALLETEGKPVETTKSDILRATWFSDTEPGIYQARVKVSYDGETADLERLFNLGAPLIKIVNVTAEPIINGTIGKVSTEIQSYWNQDIENVYIELFVKGTLGETIAYHKSQNFRVKAFYKQTMVNYFDTTKGIEPGEYKGLVVLLYLGKNDTAEVDLEVKLKPGFFIGIETLLIIIVVVAVIIVGFFVFYTKRRRKYKQKRLV